MTYQEALHTIQNAYKLGRKLGLSNITELLETLGHPEDEYKIIHVAGTNGKGSTSRMISQMLEETGFKVGFYSSPHLERYNERFMINSEYISDGDFAESLSEVLNAVKMMNNYPSEFELLTAMGFVYFRNKKVDYAVIEVGLGGRLDATNAIRNPELSIITPIGIDHTNFLGNTLSAVASEKAGIIKDGHKVLLSLQEPEALNTLSFIAKQRQAQVYQVSEDVEVHSSDLNGSHFTFEGEDYKLQQLGRYQVDNSMTAITAAKILGIPQEKIKSGLFHTFWPGRLEKVYSEPDIYLDGSHNPQGAKAIRNVFLPLKGKRRMLGVVASLKDKDIQGVIEVTADLFDYLVATEPHSDKIHEAEEVRGYIESMGVRSTAMKDLKEAFFHVFKMASADDVIICYGSFYLIGDLRKLIREEL